MSYPKVNEREYWCCCFFFPGTNERQDYDFDRKLMIVQWITCLLIATRKEGVSWSQWVSFYSLWQRVIYRDREKAAYRPESLAKVMVIHDKETRSYVNEANNRSISKRDNSWRRTFKALLRTGEKRLMSDILKWKKKGIDCLSQQEKIIRQWTLTERS